MLVSILMVKVAFSSNSLKSTLNFRGDIIRHFHNQNKIIYLIAPKDLADHPILKLKNVHFTEISLSPKGLNPLTDLCYLFQLLWIYFKLKPSLIFHFTIKPNIFGSLACYLCKIPSVSVITGLGYAFINTGLISRFVQSLYKLSLQIPKQIWFLNQDDLNLFNSLSLVKIDKAICINGEGINTDYFSPQVSTTEAFNVLLIARLLKDKGLYEYIAAAEKIKKLKPNIEFQILGPFVDSQLDGISKDVIQKAESQGFIKYLGETDDVRPYIANSTVVVLPSYREGIPRSLLEASAMEKPVVATKVPGCSNVVIHNVTGYLCEPRSTESLTQTILKVINLTPQQRENLGANGRSFVIENYSIKKTIEFYENCTKLVH